MTVHLMEEELSALFRDLRDSHSYDELATEFADFYRLSVKKRATVVVSLKKISRSSKQLSMIDKRRSTVKDKSYYSEWRGIDVFLACKAILDIENISAEDEVNPYARKLRAILANIENAIEELDEFALDIAAGDDDASVQLIECWDAIELLEEELTDLLNLIGWSKFDCRSDPSLHHSLRIIKRFDFSRCILGREKAIEECSSALDALRFSNMDVEMMQQPVTSFLERAARANIPTGLFRPLLAVCQLIAAKEMKAALPQLEELLSTIRDEDYRGYWDRRHLVKIYIFRTIIELEGVSPGDRNNKYARLAKKQIERYSKLVKKREEVWRLSEIGDGKADEGIILERMENQLSDMKDVLRKGLPAGMVRGTGYLINIIEPRLE